MSKSASKKVLGLPAGLLALAASAIIIGSLGVFASGRQSQFAQVVSSTIDASKPAVSLYLGALADFWKGRTTVSSTVSIIQTLPKANAELANFRVNNLPKEFKRGALYTLYIANPVGVFGGGYKLSFSPRLEVDSYFIGKVTIQCTLSGCPANTFTIIGMPRVVESGRIYDGIVLLNEQTGTYGIFKLSIAIDKEK